MKLNNFYNPIKKFKRIFILTLILFSTINAQSKIAVLYSGYTEKQGSEESTFYIDQFTAWEIFLMQQKIPYNVIYDNELESGISEEYDVLILPSVMSISDQELNSIKEYLEIGKSILSVGSTFIMDENGMQRDYSNLESIFGIRIDENALSDKMNFFHSLSSSPIFKDENNLDRVIQISNKNFPLTAAINSDKTFPVGFYQIDVTENLPNPLSSIVFGYNGAGKFIWIGFDITSVIGGKEDTQEFENLVLKSLKWLDKNPEILISNYPEEKKAAVILTLENYSGLQPEFIDLLKKENYDPHLIITPSIKLLPALQNKISNDNYILDLSSYSLNSIDDYDKIISLISLSNSEFGISLKSVLLSNSSLDISFLSSLKEAGIELVLFNSPVSAAPFLSENSILFVPMLRDYSNGIADKEDSYSKKMNWENYYLQYYQAVELNALFFHQYDSRINCNEKLREDYLSMLERIKDSDAWFPSLIELKDWWVIKENISVKTKSFNENTLEFILSNNNFKTVESITVIVSVGDAFNKKFLTIKSGSSDVDYTIDDKTDGIKIHLKDISSRQSKNILIKFNEE